MKLLINSQNLEVDKLFHLTHNRTSGYLSLLGLKLTRVDKNLGHLTEQKKMWSC